MTNQSKIETQELIIIGIRLLFFIIFMNYGIGKLTGGQFGRLTEQELNTPLKDLSLFKISWYLFDHQPFKAFIGISQIIAAVLLLFNRTFVLGLLIFIPIIANILIIDLTIMPYGFKVAFFFRLSAYLAYIAFVLYYYRASLTPAFKSITAKREFHSKITKKWKYILLLAIVPLLEVVSGILKFIFLVLSHPQTVWEGLKGMF